MATTRYYDPASGTWKTEQSTPTAPGGTLTMSQVYGLTATITDLLTKHAEQATQITALTSQVTDLQTAVGAAQSTADAALAASSSGSGINAAVQQALDNKADDADLNDTPIHLYWNGTSWPPAPVTNRPIVWNRGPSAPTDRMKSTDVWEP